MPALVTTPAAGACSGVPTRVGEVEAGVVARPGADLAEAGGDAVAAGDRQAALAARSRPCWSSTVGRGAGPAAGLGGLAAGQPLGLLVGGGGSPTPGPSRGPSPPWSLAPSGRPRRRPCQLFGALVGQALDLGRVQGGARSRRGWSVVAARSVVDTCVTVFGSVAVVCWAAPVSTDRSSDTEAEQRDGEGGDAVLEPALCRPDVRYQGATRDGACCESDELGTQDLLETTTGVQPRRPGSGSVILPLETTS